MSDGQRSLEQFGRPGSYHGRPSLRLDNGHCWLDFLSEGGPRIVGFGLPNGENILAETPEVGWESAYGFYELVGGHRLWMAPEAPRCSSPDISGLSLAAAPAIEGWPSGVRLVGASDISIGLRREIEVRLGHDSGSVHLRHLIFNEGSEATELSPWPITQLKLGGIATAEMPAPTTAHAFKPNQLIALWPYASWNDERLTIGEGSVSVAAVPASRMKIGCLSSAGTVTYVRDGVAFTKDFEPLVDLPRPDLGCNLEIYTDDGAIELESLGPLVNLEPGASVIHDERWQIRRIE
jgi:hypothetical protein